MEPKFDTKEDLEKWMQSYVASMADTKPSAEVEVKDKSSTLQKEMIQRVPIFSGQTKSDHIPFSVWFYEMQCPVKERHYSEAAILNAARRSLRGDTSKVAVRLGTEVTLSQLMNKMKRLYGDRESGEELLAKFYSTSQDEDESVVAWSCRLEDLMDSATQAGHFTRQTSQETLRSKFWSGLKHPLKELSSHKFDQIKDYENLTVKVRKIENSLPEAESQSKSKGSVNAL